MSYLDALVHGVSTSTQTGLIPTNFAVFSRLGQVILAGIMLLGNGVLITLAPVVTRLYYWHKFSNQHSRSDEYFALWQLLIIVPSYYCFFVGLGWIVLGVYAASAPDALDLMDKNSNNPAWWGLYHSMSAFGNCGYSTFADSMVQWQTQPLPLIVMSILILVGNTAFPLMMRLIVYTLWRVPFLKRSKHVYRYLLDHPRRCYTHLFPAPETRWLLVLLLFLNSVEFLFELILDWDNAAYLQLNAGYKLVNMYFQAIAIRTAGFNSVDLTKLSSAILWLYVGMMYISASPVAITVRYTGQAKNQSRDDSIEAASRAPHKKNTVGSQVQNVFVKHFVCVFLAILFISMIEEVPLAVDPNYSLFKIIFEVVSAYGTVGLSLGYGSNPTSFLGVLSGGSKLVLSFMMILGKHRNLPDSIDTAVTVPKELLFEETDLDEIEVLSESDGDDATQRQRYRDHSHRGHHRHRHEADKKKTKRSSRHVEEDIEESEERKRPGPENEKREVSGEEESEGEDEEGSQFDTGEEDIELGRRNRW
ncbi:cation transport domain containing protein [Acanthamoeba castellanii str. Neff]|uniref:Cation transport domain containing protein n=1 Tax=Acanthamoeba castellanii (strain ATCC 30010 / Neff) TaxID=1257118 RepID=L8HI03_ACACF|nr:cation transport domain containing protein [Acanthamoeba castellanii str. Neff]ELR24825.1 cation transport domain containing protein [Acanthamoeba castellanii str. Neff]